MIEFAIVERLKPKLYKMYWKAQNGKAILQLAKKPLSWPYHVKEKFFKLSKVGINPGQSPPAMHIS